MPTPSTSVKLVPVKNLEELSVGDLIVFRKRLYQISRFPEQNNPDNPSLEMKVLWGEPCDTKSGWRALSTLSKEGAFKLVIE